MDFNEKKAVNEAVSLANNSDVVILVLGDDTRTSGESRSRTELNLPGHQEELLKAVVIASANDACTALGEYIAGSSSGFVDMMNERASQLGLKNTNFENCTGLDDSVKNHYSSAYDLAVISREIMKHKIITKYSTVWLDSLRGGKTELNNTNKLVNTCLLYTSPSPRDCS